MKIKIPILVGVAISCLLSQGAIADEARERSFYEGQTVELMVGFSAGGGYDTYARTLARHLPKHIPGNPNVVVKNVPGAGSLVLMNQIANSLPADGSVFALVNSGIPFEPLFGNKQAKFKVQDVNWIGSLADDTVLGVANTDSGIEHLLDLREKSMTMGGSGAGSSTNFMPRVLTGLFDLNLKVIAGYPGSTDIVLAMERGEVDGIGGQFMSTIMTRTPEWLAEDRKVNHIYQLAMKKHELLPDVDLVRDMAETEDQRQAVDLLAASLMFARPFVAPPGMDTERLNTLRTAMKQTAQDPEFLADAKRQSLPVNFGSGEEMLAFFAKIEQTPEHIVEIVKSSKN
ncbi:Bug family tripartite tricarboxylate transporter substrate binding protein [Marinobacter sp. BSs20148]|uniref:Bug family tripartite tricarboxylate transporter substrate binding protein n=1 Tax=Marinobacter sp. BSs20148 TaxID=490759 RepID=UPI0005A113A0|nr:tripartite tricarboxylate transporter substrate-binding protein [Marinobacter sp. BSs20148]